MAESTPQAATAEAAGSTARLLSSTAPLALTAPSAGRAARRAREELETARPMLEWTVPWEPAEAAESTRAAESTQAAESTARWEPMDLRRAEADSLPAPPAACR